MRRPAVAAILAVTVLLVTTACGVTKAPPSPDQVDSLAPRHLQTFRTHDNPVDDPGSPGERRAIEYARAYLQSLGLRTSVQKVPLTGLIPTASTVRVHGAKGDIRATSPSDGFIVWPGQQRERVALDAELVFAGYGIVSPEYQRDDYKGLDLTGKCVLVLEGSPKSGTRDDLGVLGQTYYGTRFYKFAEAARHHAAAILIVHADGVEAWADLRDAATGSTLDIDAQAMSGKRPPRAMVEGWLSRPAADSVLALADLDYDTLVEHARQLAFHPVALPGVAATFDITSRVESFTSQDVLAYLPGRSSEYVMLAGRWNTIDPATWAHGFASAGAPDDDGSGAAMVLEAARRIVTEGRQPGRGIMFMVATALKPGIVGLEYFHDQPPAGISVERMTALIFLDRGELSGLGARAGKIGTGSDAALAQIARQAAIEQGRLIELDASPLRRFYYGLGQTELAHEGTRMIYLTTRPEHAGSGRLLRGVAKRDAVVGLPDAVAPPPAVADPSRDAALLATITLRVANATNWPPRHEPWRPPAR